MRTDAIAVSQDELIWWFLPAIPGQSEKVSLRQLGAETFVAHIVASSYREKVTQAFKSHKTLYTMDIELPTLTGRSRVVAMERSWRGYRRSAWKVNSLAEKWWEFRCGN